MKFAATPHVIPGPLVQANVTIAVAGRTFKQSFSPTPDQVMTFTWDGYDAFGRLLQGTQHAIVTIDNVYEGVYANAPSFGSPANSATSIGTTRNPIELGGNRIYDIGNWDAEGMGLGGWDFDVHHVYDPIARSVLIGSGAPPPSNRALNNIITTVAGIGSGTPSPDGTPANQAIIRIPHDVAISSDGLVYFSEANCIRRVTAAGVLETIAGDCAGGSGGGPTGFPITPDFLAFGPSGNLYFSDGNRIRKANPATFAVTTVAGNGDFGFNGDDQPATAASLESPSGVVVGPDESVYIADELNERVRKVGSDGIIRTVVGGGGSAPSEGVVATDMSLPGALGLAIGPDGSLFIAEAFGPLVLRVSTDGRVHIFAGTTDSGAPRGDGGPATAASVDARDLAVGRDGTVYIKESRTVRQVDPAGIITTVAGSLSGNSSLGDNGPATAAFLSLQSTPGIDISPDGVLYIADEGNERIRRIAAALPGVQTTDLVLPSRDGRELYVFNFAGKHLRTLDAFVTSAPPLYQFAYDAGTGFLTTVTDVDGNVTTVQRDGSGDITGIQAPFGQVTTVALGGDGYVASVTSPASETTGFTYYPGGLMKTRTSPRGFVSSYSYDAQGRLTQDTDPPEAGGFQSLARTDSATGWTVARSTKLNRTTQYVISEPSTGTDRTRTNTLPDGHVATRVDHTDGTHATTMPDGTVVSTTDSPDPRFGMSAPVTSTTIQTPAGLIRTEVVTRTAALSDPTNLLSLTSADETHEINGRQYDSAFDPSTRTFTTTSPRGRRMFVVLDAHAHVASTQIDTLLADQLAYDSQGRLSTNTTGTRITQFGYHPSSGFLTSITDPLSQVTQILPDAVGRTSKVTYPDTNFTQFGYDAEGNLASITPPGQPQRQQTFNAVNLLATYQPPAASGTGTTQTTYGYDFDRALGAVTRPDGLLVQHGYDSAGRLQTITLPTGTITRSYNPTTGHLSSISGPGGETVAFGYDGFLRTTTTLSGPVAGTVTMTYDNDFRVASKAVNASAAIAFTYDSDSLLTSAGSMTLTPRVATNLLDSTAFGVVQDTFDYDSFGAFASHAASANSTSLFSEAITQRDALGRIKTKTETVQGTSHTYDYTYNTRGHLTDVKIDGVQSAHYAFDPPFGENGNRTSKTAGGTTTNATYDGQDRLLTYGPATYTYGANGELRTKTIGTQATTYTYDVLGNLLTVAPPGGPTIDYVVDGLGRRVGKKINGALVKGFLYEDQLRVIAELDGSNNIVSTFVYGAKVNVPEYMIRGGVTYRIVTDHVGSVRLVVNTSSGAVAERIDYDEFGIVANDTNPGFQPFGFAGGLYDNDTRLVRFGARDYDADLGRWVSKDSLQLSDRAENLYAYVSNDPINLIDPSGREDVPVDYPWDWNDVFNAISAAGAAAANICVAFGGGLLTSSDSSEDPDNCQRQWLDARQRCADIITSKQTPERRRLRGGPNNDIHECAKGFVSEKCGGNAVDYGSGSK